MATMKITFKDGRKTKTIIAESMDTIVMTLSPRIKEQKNSYEGLGIDWIK